MKPFRVTFPEIVVVEEDKQKVREYISNEIDGAEFERDINEFTSILEIENEQQIPEGWDKDGIPWGLSSQATVEEWIKLSQVFKQLDDEETQILTEMLKYGTT